MMNDDEGEPRRKTSGSGKSNAVCVALWRASSCVFGAKRTRLATTCVSTSRLDRCAWTASCMMIMLRVRRASNGGGEGGWGQHQRLAIARVRRPPPFWCTDRRRVRMHTTILLPPPAPLQHAVANIPTVSTAVAPGKKIAALVA